MLRTRSHLRPLVTGHLRARRDDGTAMVEFAMVSLLFVVLLFGIINMGILLSFKQNLTQAASESARASIAVVDDPATTTVDERYQAVDDALADTVAEYGKACGTPGTTTTAGPGQAVPTSGVTCLRKIHECGTSTIDYEAVAENTSPSDPCLTVRIEFANQGDDRLLPAFPIVSSLEPDTMSSQTTVRLVPVNP